MKARHWFYRCLALASALSLAVACVDDITNDIDLTGNVAKIIPYSVTANSATDTKVGLTARNDYYFEDGDYLKVSGKRGDETIEGVLTLQSGASSQTASFSGNLTWKGGSGDKPADNFPLSFRLFSKDQSTEPFTAAITDDIVEAVQLFSTFAKESVFSQTSFLLEQGTAFINFDLTMEPAPTDGKYDIELFNNKTESMTSAQVQVTDGEAIFCAAFPGGTTLYQAKFSLAGVDFKFAGTATELKAGKKYTVSKLAFNDRLVPLTLEANSNNCTITLRIPDETPSGFSGIQYSTDNGANWLTATETTTITLNRGKKVQLKGDNASYCATTSNTFIIHHDGDDDDDDDTPDPTPISIFSDKSCFIYGNVMSLINSTSFATETTLSEGAFTGLFCNYQTGNESFLQRVLDNYIENHDTRNLILPATQLAAGCYGAMFAGTHLERAPELPAQALAEECYTLMFYGCYYLEEAPVLPATTLADACYAGMFYGCAHLGEAPALPYAELAESCYAGMFMNCTGLTTVPDLDINKLSFECCSYMFSGCTSLTEAPNISVLRTNPDESEACFSKMFNGCTSLTTPPVLDISTASLLPPECFRAMFSGCTSLEIAPDLPFTHLSSGCYSDMFKGCSKLRAITCLARASSEEEMRSYTGSWMEGVAPYGVFTRSGDMPYWTPASSSGIPVGWKVIPEIPNYEIYTPLTLEATGTGAIVIDNPFELTMWYMKNGVVADPTDSDPITINVVNGDKVCLFGNNSAYGGNKDDTMIDCTVDCYIYGNVMSLVGGYDFTNVTTLDEPLTFSSLFHGNEHIINNSKKLVLPAQQLSRHCYSYMFAGCTGLTAAPLILAKSTADYCCSYMFAWCTNLVDAPTIEVSNAAESCYYYMFYECTSLTDATASLPAVTLSRSCYESMFENCTSLANPPSLPANVLAPECYACMFMGCTSLLGIDNLPASTLVDRCYTRMFYGCSNVGYIKCGATNYNADNLGDWVEGVAPSGTFVAAADATNWQVGPSGIPLGWTVQGLSTTTKFTYHMEHCLMADMPISVSSGTAYRTNIVPDEGYRPTSVTVKMNGTDITSTSYDPDTWIIYIPGVSGPVDITVTCTSADNYMITYHIGENVTLTSTPASVPVNGSFTTSIYPVSPANKVFLSVRMGGVIVTDDYWDDYNNTLYIDCVTGDVDIIVSGKEVYFINLNAPQCWQSNPSNYVFKDYSYDCTFSTTDLEYEIYGAKITMGGVDISECYTPTSLHSGTVHIDQVTGDLDIEIISRNYVYWVDQNLTYITSSFTEMGLESGRDFYAVLTPRVNYHLDVDHISITMGGQPIDVSECFDPVYRTISINPVTGNIVIDAEAVPGSNNYSIEYTYDGVTLSNTQNSINEYATYECVVTPLGTNNGADVKIERQYDDSEYWEDITYSCWNYSTNTIHIRSVTGNLRITVSGCHLYSITRNLSNCFLMQTNHTNSIKEGDPYQGWIQINSGCVIKSVTVLMNNIDITSDCYSGTTISIPAANGDIIINVICEQTPVSVTYRLDNDIISDNTATSVSPGSSYTTTLRSSNIFHYTASAATSFGGTQMLISNDAVWDEQEGCYIGSIYLSPTQTTAPLTISAYEGTGIQYTITKNLNNCSLSNPATRAKGSETYTTTITPTSGMVMDNVSVKMGYNDITSTCYNASTNTITIESVTADITITASAKEPAHIVTYELSQAISHYGDNTVEVGEFFKASLWSSKNFNYSVYVNGSLYTSGAATENETVSTKKGDSGDGYKYTAEIYIPADAVTGDIRVVAEVTEHSVNYFIGSKYIDVIEGPDSVPVGESFHAVLKSSNDVAFTYSVSIAGTPYASGTVGSNENYRVEISIAAADIIGDISITADRL